MSDTLADALPRAIARVAAKKERWEQMMREYDMGPGMQFSINIMRLEIENAVKACASGDIGKMVVAYENLKGYEDDD